MAIRRRGGALAREESRMRAVVGRAILLASVSGPAAFAACTTSAPHPKTQPTATPIQDSGSGDPDAANTCASSMVADASLPDGDCAYVMSYPCGLPTGVDVIASCYFTLSECETLCPLPYIKCHLADSYCSDAGVPELDAGVQIECQTCTNGAGRRPDGLAPPTFVRAATELGAYYARAAHMEAASVFAFRRLRCELARWGAPRPLVRAAARAAREEAAHARAATRLAHAHGGTPARVRVRTMALRDLEAIAIENMAEGCVRETLGAAVTLRQAARARDPHVRAVMSRIAQDELRHAGLAWAVARWASRRLDDAGRARVAAARDMAVEALRVEVAHAPAPSASLASDAGLPGIGEMRTLVTEMTRVLWS